jgi:hypothetical protein
MIEILGSIEGELDGHQVFLSAEGQELRLEIDHPHQLLRTLNAGRSVRNTAVRRLARELYLQCMTLRVFNQGKTVAVLGYAAKAGLVSRLLRVPHLELGRNWRALRLLMERDWPTVQ